MYCRDGQSSFSPRIVMKLIEEAKGVPVIFAIVTNTGHVLLEVRPVREVLCCVTMFIGIY